MSHGASRPAFSRARPASLVVGLAVCLLSLVTVRPAIGQSIVTVAGGGPIGDGLPATRALLSIPTAMAFDAANNLYIVDYRHHCIRRVDTATGIIRTYAGGGTSGFGDGGPATLAEVWRPGGIAFDAAGNLVIAQEGRIRRVDSRTGVITTIAGGGEEPFTDGIEATAARLEFELGPVVFDRRGNMYVGAGFALVLKLEAATGRIFKYAGTGQYGYSGDGGPATKAELKASWHMALDTSDNLYISDVSNYRVRRVDATTGIITTFAGNGSPTPSGDGGPATDAGIGWHQGLAFDREGNLFISVGAAIRRVEAKTGIITTWQPSITANLVGGGSLEFDQQFNLYYSGDRDRVLKFDSGGNVSVVAGGGSIGEGTPAVAASLFDPMGIVIAPDGDVVIADSRTNRIRRLDRATGNLDTIFGNGELTNTGDGGPATQATIFGPTSVDYDAAGNLFATNGWEVRRVDAVTGIVSTAATGLSQPNGIAAAKNGDLFVSESCAHRVLRIAAGSGAISVVAGVGEPAPICPTDGSYGGDGGPATQAHFDKPAGIALDSEENLYIADNANHRIRRVDAKTGIITTVVGGGTDGYDGIAATDLSIWWPTDVTFDKEGRMYVLSHPAVHRIDGGRSWLIAGGRDGAKGDNGPAVGAGLMFPFGVAVDAGGNLFISDRENQKIRAVFACGALTKPQLQSPQNVATNVPTGATFTWSRVDKAFRYDVLVDTVSPPRKFAAKELTSNVFTVANLKPGTTYYWNVIAKGDPLCYIRSAAGSEIRSFTTATACQAPSPFNLTGPADGAAAVIATPPLSWNAAQGASAYDIYLGSSNPPPLAATVSTTSYIPPPLVAGTTYTWFVVAHASCDTTLTTRTTTRSFTVAGGCGAATSFTLTSPATGATDVATTLPLEWSPSANASSYDLHLGTTSPPPLHRPGLTAKRFDVSSLSPGRTYYWQVVGRVSCDPAKSFTTPLGSFTTREECATPGSTSIVFAPPGSVGLGQSYVIAWNPATGLDDDGSYLVERSLDASFSSVTDSQRVVATSASFVARTSGIWYHRVRAVAGCDPAKQGTVSATRSVTAVLASPNVIFTVQPEALVSPIGRNLEDNLVRFAIENIGSSAVDVVLGKAEIDSVPFFRIVDPEGGDGAFVTLQPRNPKSFEIRFSGPSNETDGSYQGLVLAVVAGSPVVPYAFVSLKVGTGAGATPRLRFGGVVSEYAFFPGLEGDDADRAPITMQIDNPGSSAMDVAAEIGPELWLVPEAGWNTAPIPPGGSRSVKLYTNRNRAPNGSALPRYTYLTVRTRSGATARMLVQDNAASSVTQGRSGLLAPDARSLIVPDAVSSASRVSRIRLSNAGSEPVQTMLVFTPDGTDGFDRSAARSAIVVVPPNDVATLTDPLVQIFSLARPASGQIEIVTSQEKSGFLTVSSSLATPADAAARAIEVPTIWRGEGARAGAPHLVPGVTLSAAEITSLTLVETTGVDGASVKLTLVDKDGVARGSRTKSISRYGRVAIASIVAELSGLTSIEAARVEIEVVSGGGSVTGIATVGDPAGRSGASIASRPVGGFTSSARQQVDESTAVPWASSAASVALAIPIVTGSGAASGSGLRTLLGLLGGKSTAVTFTIRFSDLAGQTVTKLVTVPAGAAIEYPNVLADLLGILAAAQGTLLIEMSPAGGDAYTRLLAAPIGGMPSAVGAAPVVPAGSLGLTSAFAGQQRPLYLDGMEQSTDPARGFRWNLYLTELRGSTGIVRVSLYEAGNRTVPIAEKTIMIGPLQQTRLETVFSALGLDSEERRKDRTNVLVSVMPMSGTGLISACATSVDNRTGDTKAHLLLPAGGIPATTTPSLAAPVGGVRRRPIRR